MTFNENHSFHYSETMIIRSGRDSLGFDTEVNAGQMCIEWANILYNSLPKNLTEFKFNWVAQGDKFATWHNYITRQYRVFLE